MMPSGRRRSRWRCCAAMELCSCGCWSGRPRGCRNGVIFCASIASSRRAARSEADASCPAFRASSSRFPKRWQLCAQSGGEGQTKALVSVSGADPLNLAGILTPGPKLASLAGNRVLYRDGIPLAFLEGDSTRFLEPVEPEIENRARLALHGHAEPAAHLPRLRRLAQLEAAREADEKRRRSRRAAA